MNNQITQSDVARVAGVNKSTVSRVLRNKSLVKSETRERVLKAVDELGYRPDPALSRIAALKWQKDKKVRGDTMAFVAKYRSSDSERYFDGCLSQATPLGYDLEAFYVSEFRNGVSIGSILKCRGISLVVLSGFGKLDELVGFPMDEFLTIHCGSTSPEFNICSVGVDLSKALYRIWKLAEENHYSRIGFIRESSSVEMLSDMQKEGSFYYRQKHDTFGSNIPILTLDKSTHNYDTYSRSRTLSWVKQYDPDLIIGSSSLVYAHLQHAGISIPKNRSFVSLVTDSDEGPEVSGFYGGEGQIGALAVRLLHINYLAGSNLVPLKTNCFVEPEWKTGLSFASRTKCEETMAMK